MEWKSLLPGKDVNYQILINPKTWFQIGILICIIFFSTSCNIIGNEPTLTPTTTPLPEINQFTKPPTEGSETPLWLTEKTWVLISMGNPSNLSPIEGGTLVTAIFSQNGKISGSGGCNNYNAFYETNGNKIDISPASTTMMTCRNGIPQEIEFLKALEAAQSFTVTEEGRLQITYQSKTGKEYLLSFIQGQYPLTNTLWVLQTYGDTNNPIPTVQGTSITITFSDEGLINGSAGCNNYSARYIAEGSTITITPPIRTYKSCRSGLDQENLLLSAISKADSYQINGTNLELFYDQNKSLRFTALNSPIEHTLWRLYSINQKQINQIQPITAIFKPNNALGENIVGGISGCNSYSALYDIKQNVLKIEKISSTEMICPASVSKLEKEYLSLLQSSQEYQILGDQLTILSNSGQLVFLPNHTNLEGTKWSLISWGSPKDLHSLENNTFYNISFEANEGRPSGRIHGNTYCSDFVSTYNANLNELSLDQIMISNSKDCSSDFLSQESEINKILENASSYSIIGDILQIHHNDLTLNLSALNETVLTLTTPKVETTSKPPIPTDSSSLYNQNWYLLSYEGFVVLEGNEPFVFFGSDGLLSGNTGCNSLHGTFSSNQNFINVHELTTTKEVCKEPYGTQEELFIRSLKESQTYAIKGDRLRLKSQSGVLILGSRNIRENPKPIATEIKPTNTPEFTSTSEETTEPDITQTHTKTPSPTNEQIITSPIAIIEGPPTGKTGSTITLSGMKSYSKFEIVSYLWDFGDGIKGQGKTINYTYIMAGRYTITLTITDSNGETNSTTILIDIK